MNRETINAKNAPAPRGGYSQAVKLTDFKTLLFISGQIPVSGDDKVRVVGEHLRAHRVRYDTEAVEAVADMAEISSRARGNLGLLLHEQQATREEAVDWAERWLLLDPKRAEKSVEFLLDPTWRAYISCYVEGLPLCRSFVAGDPARFERLLTEQLLPADVAA